jgi:hypothetical protein
MDKWNMSQFLNGIGGYVVRPMHGPGDKVVTEACENVITTTQAYAIND